MSSCDNGGMTTCTDALRLRTSYIGSCPAPLTMPAENLAPVAPDVQLDGQQSQTKFCSLCHSALTDASTVPAFHLLADALVCPPCRDGIRSTRQPRQPILSPSPTEQRSYRLGASGVPSNINVYHDLRAYTSQHEAPSLQSTRRHQDTPNLQSSQRLDIQSPQQQALSSFGVGAASHGQVQRQVEDGDHATSSRLLPPTGAGKALHHQHLPPLTIGNCHSSTGGSGPSTVVAHAIPAKAPGGCYALAPSPLVRQNRRTQHTLPRSAYQPDPLVDITRLRVRSQVHRCLYPGATFEGTQKSGRNSYDVTVTVVVSIQALNP